MTAVTVTDILRDQAAFEQQRFQFDNTNQRIADLIWPASSLFLQRDQPQGQRRDQFAFDSTGALANERFAAAVESLVSPRTQQWHGLETAYPELNKRNSVKRYFEAVTQVLFRARYSPGAGFTYASSEGYKSLGAFGNQCLFLDDDPARDLVYRSLFVGDIWIGVDRLGRIDRIHRKYKQTARNAKAEFGDKLPRTIATAADKSPEQEFEFLHCVKPNPNWDPGRMDWRGKRWVSYYLACGEQELLDTGGYRTLPYIFSRFTTAPGETYGRGPASMVLPTLNTANEQTKTMLRSGQRSVDPPVMTVDDDALEVFNLKSSALNRGYLSPDGTPLAVPFVSQANLQMGMEFLGDSRGVINSAFFVDLFQVLLEQPNLTATEALLRAQEKGELLGPSVGRQQTELLSPMILRELDLLSHVPGLLPDMPPELQEAGGLAVIKFKSPLDRMQQSGDGAAMLRWLESMTPVFQVKPETMNVVDWASFGRKLADIQGVPAEVMNDEDVQAEQDEMAAQKEAAAQLIQAAPLAGKAAADFAKAQTLASAQPSAVGLL